MKLLRPLLYQNPLFLFDASIVTSGVAVLLLKGILSLLFWLDSRFGRQFQGYSLFIFFIQRQGRSILIYRETESQMPECQRLDPQKCWALGARRLSCGTWHLRGHTHPCHPLLCPGNWISLSLCFQSRAFSSSFCGLRWILSFQAKWIVAFTSFSSFSKAMFETYWLFSFYS